MGSGSHPLTSAPPRESWGQAHLFTTQASACLTRQELSVCPTGRESCPTQHCVSWKRGAHCAPEAGRHQRIQVRAHSGAKQTHFCLLLLSCVTLGTWLYLSGPYTHSSVGWTHPSVGWKPGHPCQSENSGTKLRLRDQGPHCHVHGAAAAYRSPAQRVAVGRKASLP